MGAREDVFAKINAALGPAASEAPGPPGGGASRPPRAADDSTVTLFLTRVREAGGEAVTCRSAGEFLAWIGEYCRAHSIASLAVDGELVADGAPLHERIARELPGVSVYADGARGGAANGAAHSRHMAAIHAGIGRARAGIADNGAVLIVSTRSESRSLSLLPAVHVALLRARDIVPSLADAASVMEEMTKAGSAVTIVGGPSKTADIEKVLVTGVHGPARFVVALMTEEFNMSRETTAT